MLEEYKDKKFIKDSIVMISSGEYSDYGLDGLFIVLKTFIPIDELNRYLQLYPEQKEDYTFSVNKFISHLSGGGLISEIVYNTFHIGDYDSVDGVRISTDKE